MEAQVNKQMYTLALVLPIPHTYNGPTKSIPVLLNDGSVLVCSAGKSGTTEEENDFPSYRRQIVHLRIIFLTKLRPLIIQYFSLTAANVAGVPLWCTAKCLDRTTSSVNPCLVGSKIGFFIVDGKSS